MNTVRIFAILYVLEVEKHYLEGRLFMFCQVKSFQEFSHELCNWGNCLWKFNFESWKRILFFLKMAKYSCLCMNLFLPLFSLLTWLTKWSATDLQHFSVTKKRKYYAFSNAQVDNKEMHIVFDFDAKFLWDTLWKSVLWFGNESSSIWLFKFKYLCVQSLSSQISVHLGILSMEQTLNTQS